MILSSSSSLLLLLLLSTTALPHPLYHPTIPHPHPDAFAACTCIQTVLSGYRCPPYIAYSTRVCLPSAPPFYQSVACLSLCCTACQSHGLHWPLCHNPSINNLCRSLAAHLVPMQLLQPTPTPDDDDDDLLQPSVVPTSTPGLDDLDLAILSPSPDTLVEHTRLPQPSLSVFEMDGPVMPGELDISPSMDRPFAPAACECMVQGTACSARLAASSGVCEPHTAPRFQPPDCIFACCRICTVNMDVSYCQVAKIQRLCRRRFPQMIQ